MAQWEISGLVPGGSRVRNQVDALVPFRKALYSEEWEVKACNALAALVQSCYFVVPIISCFRFTFSQYFCSLLVNVFF